MDRQLEDLVPYNRRIILLGNQVSNGATDGINCSSQRAPDKALLNILFKYMRNRSTEIHSKGLVFLLGSTG